MIPEYHAFYLLVLPLGPLFDVLLWHFAVVSEPSCTVFVDGFNTCWQSTGGSFVYMLTVYR